LPKSFGLKLSGTDNPDRYRAPYQYHMQMFTFLAVVLGATLPITALAQTCSDEESGCEGSAVRASAMLQMKSKHLVSAVLVSTQPASQARLPEFLLALSQSDVHLDAARLCLPHGLVDMRLDAVHKPLALLSMSPSTPTAGEDPSKACGHMLNAPSGTSNACAVAMGDGKAAKEGTCSCASAYSCFCMVGPQETCKHYTNLGDSCTFEGIAGKCSTLAQGSYCNVWPLPSTSSTTAAPATTPTVGADPYEACGRNQRGSCAVNMGEGKAAKESTCSKAGLSGFCNVGKSDTCLGFTKGGSCTFEGVEGKCDMGPPGPYCNVWPILSTSPTTAAPTTAAPPTTPTAGEDPSKACGHLPYPLPPDFDLACSVDMGVGKVAKAGLCTSFAQRSFWCKVGQFEACQDQAAGDKCSFEGIDGNCDNHNGALGGLGPGSHDGIECNIWPIKPPNAIKTEVKKGVTQLPVVSNAGFGIGQVIVIDAGTPIEETNTIIGFGSLILKTPLQYDHAPGVLVTAQAPKGSTNPSVGASAPIDAGGFKDVTSLCCPEQTEVFFNRLLDKMGFRGCSVPHVQGLMHWFSCVPDMDFQYLVDVINNGNPCKYWALKDDVCPVLSPKCAGTYCR